MMNILKSGHVLNMQDFKVVGFGHYPGFRCSYLSHSPAMYCIKRVLIEHFHMAAKLADTTK